ncbi:MAG: hypothetical protein IJ933_01090 [Bacteroidales bacterium]|nr:hypothetical protein [Bacteroidales bacterium]
MKIKATFIALALILAMTSLLSCNQTPKQMLTGEFKITSITTDRKMPAEETEIWTQAMEDIKESTLLILNADGTMQETVSGVTTKGTWEVIGEEGEEGEAMVLKIVKENKSTINMKISELSGSGFTYVEPDKATQSQTVISYTKVK